MKWKYLSNPNEAKKVEKKNCETHGSVDSNNKMVNINPTTSLVTLNTNGLNTPS